MTLLRVGAANSSIGFRTSLPRSRASGRLVRLPDMYTTDSMIQRRPESDGYGQFNACDVVGITANFLPVLHVTPAEGRNSPRLAFGDGPPRSYMAQPRACAISVSPQYFRAAGTRVLQGRPFTDEDNADTVTVAIVNQAFAQRGRTWPAIPATQSAYRRP
jgi:hypothetical protein